MIEVTGRVRHDGETYKPGDIIEQINKQQAQRLVDLGVAFFISGKLPLPNEGLRNTEEEIDENYQEELNLLEYADLKTVAKEVGLEFKGNISKKDLIDLIINKGKADKILALTEVEE